MAEPQSVNTVGAGPAEAKLILGELLDLKKKLTELELKYQSLASLNGLESKLPAPPVGERKDKTSATTQTSSTGDEDIGKKRASRAKIITSTQTQDGDHIEKTEEELSKKQDKGPQEHAFTLKKLASRGYSEIDISNPDLWELLKEHLGWFPNHIFRGSAVTLYSPFQPFIFEWKALWEAALKDPEGDKDKQAREDLALLLQTISNGHSGDVNLDRYFKAMPSYMTPGAETVQFQDLWTVFPPGTLIYGTPFQNEDQLFVVKENKGAWPRRDPRRSTLEYTPWRLEAWSYDWNDGSFGRTSFMLSFDPFDGYLPLTSLDYYPFKLHLKHDSVWEKLVSRGKVFRELCKAKRGLRLFQYDGDAVMEKKGFSGLIQENRPEPFDIPVEILTRASSDMASRIRGKHAGGVPAKSTKVTDRVMVDYASYFQYGPDRGRNGALSPGDSNLNCVCSDCMANEGLMTRYRIRFDKRAEEKEWADEQYALCPPRVLGYILRDKQWAQLQVDKVQSISHDETSDAWNSRLKLANKDTKLMLFDLVRSHNAKNRDGKDEIEELEVDDIVPGKGKGLVILLYGPPGVGKTTTAETIAVAARKPLFSVSVADVGTQAKHVEANLSKIFALAATWQAILLIDEADVFLESRGRGGVVQSTDKNALVSVFLRVLEYYQGIMFLTTNQIAEFDIAIPSRIHVAIQYQSLNEDQMQAIFKGFLDRLNQKGLIEDYRRIDDWLKEDVFQEGFDGRQIRNVVTTALSLARAEKKFKQGNGKLTKQHMKKAFNNVKRFKNDFQTQMERYKEAQGKMIK
ncbi:hypothetical protein PG989_013634 [Apiospora arundinis]